MKIFSASAGNYRWTVCALVFFATTTNYIDRVVISLLKSDLSTEFNWDDGDYANLEISFKLTYALGMIVAGRFIDRFGTKIGYAVATTLWSLISAAHAWATGTISFIVVRGALGLAESANFPAAIKIVAEWFPKRERALATGIFNSGTNIGAVIAPLTVPFIVVSLGWQWAFIISGSFGLIWLIFWLRLYDTPSRQQRLTQQEFNLIHADPDAADEPGSPRIPWYQLLTYRQTWAFVLGKFLTDPIWWFYLFWLPDFLQSSYGLKGTDLSLPVAFVYSLCTIGSIAGGWLPLRMIQSGSSVFTARRRSMLIFAFCVLPIVAAQWLGSYHWMLAVLVIGIAASAHQAWSANIFTTVSDMFPKSAVGSVTGIGGMFGSLGGLFLSLFVQKSLFVHYRAIGQIEVAYYIMFLICGAAYLSAWVILQWLAPERTTTSAAK